MAPHHSNNPNPESSDDESAPETISLVQSKKEIKKLDAELKNAKVAVNQSKRRQNRQVDMKLKERAVINRSGRGKKGDELEDRMQRAMQEAEDEMDDEDENRSEGEAGLENTDDDEEDDAEDVSSIEDEQGSEEGEEGEAEISLPKPLKKKSFNANHLPDELFTAAFASKASTSKRKATDVEKEDNPQRQTRKKRKRSQTQKDMIIGYAFFF
jgi:hypothetical protein